MDRSLWAKIAVLAALYVVAGKLGLSVALAYGNVTPVWAPTGLALAALLLWGGRVWPGIALGAFIVNVTTPIPVWAAAALAVGNTAEGLAGAYLARRMAPIRPSLDTVRDVIALIIAGAVIAPTIAATIGTTSLLLAGEISPARYAFAWTLYWMGDGMGALVVTPLLLVWSRGLPRWSAARVAEGVALLAVLGGLGYIVFFDERWGYPYVLFPLLVAAALRFKQRGATLAMFVVTGLALGGAVAGSVRTDGADPVQNVEVLQALTGIVGVTVVILGAAILEREKAEADKELSVSLLRSTIESTTDGILVVDGDGRVVSANRRFGEMWGIPDDVLASRDDDRAIEFVARHLKDPEMFVAKIREVYGQPEAESFDVIEFNDGRIFERYSQPQRLGDKAIGRVWSFRDVTQRVRSEAALRRETKAVQLLQRVAAASNEAQDVGDALATAVDAVCAYTGWPVGHVYLQVSATPEVLEPTGIWHLESPERFATLKQVTEATPLPPGVGLPGRVLASGKPVWITDVTQDDNLPRAAAAGDIGVRSAFAFPILVGRDVAGVLEFFSDEPAEPDDDLLELMMNVGAQLGRVIERKTTETFRSEFIAAAAHELRTPVTSMVGLAALLSAGRDKMTEEQIEACVGGLTRQGERMRVLVNNLLDLTRMQQGRLKVELNPVSVAAVARRALRASPPPDGKSVEVRVADDVRVLGDADRLDQVFTNLLLNAYRYGGSTVSIDAKTFTDEVLITVTDDGPGVPPSLVPNLFDVFTRGDNSAGIRGSGLGLAIVRMLVEASGGDVWYEDGTPRGARFMMRMVPA